MYISKITLQNTAVSPNAKFHKNNVRKVTQQNPANLNSQGCQEVSLGSNRGVGAEF